MGSRNNDNVADSISDPTEWLGTPLAGFLAMDTSLRCQVCKDFFDTAMMTSCSHTFCSLCIRRCLAVDGKCPTCRASEQEVKLRRNWALDEVVNAFQNVRKSTLQYAKESQRTLAEDIHRPIKRKFRDMNLDSDGVGDIEQTRKTRSQTRSQTRKEADLVAANPTTPIEISEDRDEDYNDGLVACPMCGRRMKEEKVYLHLDRCEDEKKQSDGARSVESQSPMPSTWSPRKALPQPPVNALERLPKLNYSLYKENALRKKLNELGIRASGPKSMLERRHTEWVSLWNANCDSSRPRSKRDLLQELDLWERTQGTLAPASAGPGSSVAKKDFDGAAWAATHNSDFQRLIEEAKRKRSVPPSASAQTSQVDARDTERPMDTGNKEKTTAANSDYSLPVVLTSEGIIPMDADNGEETAAVNPDARLLVVSASEGIVSMDAGNEEETAAANNGNRSSVISTFENPGPLTSGIRSSVSSNEKVSENRTDTVMFSSE